MASQSIGVPTLSGMKNAFMDAAVGAGGGLVMALSQAIFGSGLIGALVSILLAGSVVKGTRGQILATMAGYSLFAGGLGGSSAQASSASEVM